MDAHSLIASQRRIEEFEKFLATYCQYGTGHQSINNKAS
jgi:uncharacterized protein YutD